MTDALTLILNVLRSWDFGDDTGETMRKHYAEVVDDMGAMVEALRELPSEDREGGGKW